ncbi:MAG: type III pantothenate kinase [Muribaculaceae bacterium]|nr:type III pantothenate kinase [Muribaculaceae bacterium]
MYNSRKILTVDIGNTAVKASVFEGERLLDFVAGTDVGISEIMMLMKSEVVKNIACCCVGEDKKSIISALSEVPDTDMLVVAADTPLPIAVHYRSRATLGADRIAAAVGVAAEDENILMVDAGTAVTIDIVAGRSFSAGNISPGLKLRFRSLHAYTSRLPLVGPDGDVPHFGYDTPTAIRAGVMRGLAGEIASAWHFAYDKYENLKLILAGGDAPIIEPLLRQTGLNPILDHNAVGRGLVRIFNHNYPL